MHSAKGSVRWNKSKRERKDKALPHGAIKPPTITKNNFQLETKNYGAEYNELTIADKLICERGT